VRVNKKLLILELLLVIFYSCKKETNMPCTLSAAVIVLNTASHPCSGTGAVQITEPVGANYQYKIDSQPFQNQPKFFNLNVGKHILVVKDQNGCEAIKEIILDTIEQGNRFSQVRQILTNRCSSCHSGNNPHAGIDFTKNCYIINNWDRIYARAVNGIPSPMPQAGLIPLEERNKIIEWITYGHKYEN
jgi:hypothetical protein